MHARSRRLQAGGTGRAAPGAGPAKAWPCAGARPHALGAAPRRRPRGAPAADCAGGGASNGYTAPRRAGGVSGGEIRVPKEAREFVPSWAEPTMLGDPRGAARQYRHGSLHIREYADHYTVHTDRADPRRDPVGHLMHDAPEVLAGLAAGAAAGALAYLKSRASGRGRRSSAAAGAAAALSAGSLAYEGAKRLKER